MNEKLQKIKNWFARNASWLVAVGSFIAGIFFGRKSLRTVVGDLERARELIDQLQAESESLRGELSRLDSLNSEDAKRIAVLEAELNDARRNLERLGSTLESNDANIGGLDGAIAKLRTAIERYREELEAIKISGDRGN